MDLSPRAYHRTPEMHLREGSLVADRGRHNIGYLKDITPYGATFQPLDLKGYQKEKALLYVSLRDATSVCTVMNRSGARQMFRGESI